MTKEMIISSNGHETMVAILEDDLVAEIFVERERQRGVVGNVYKGRVSKVLPGMQSSFIDLGLERDGFLYVADVIDTLEEFDKLEARRRGRRRQRQRQRRGAPEREPRRSRRSRTCSRKARRSSSRSSRSRSAPRAPGSPRTSRCRDGSWCSCRPSITSACRARSNRARSAAGCAASSASSARRTASPAASSSAPPRRAGPRKTSSATSRRSTRSGPRSARRWSRRARPPCVYREQSLVGKLLRDLLTDDFQAIRIDNAQEYQRVLELVERILPTSRRR